MRVSVAPRVGAWIEIMSPATHERRGMGRSPRPHKGDKMVAWIEICHHKPYPTKPSRRSPRPRKGDKMGAWIEIVVACGVLDLLHESLPASPQGG